MRDCGFHNPSLLTPEDRAQVKLFERLLKVLPPPGDRLEREDIAWLARDLREWAFPDWEDWHSGEACWGMGV